MKMKKYNFGYFFKEGIRGIFLHGLMSSAAVCSIVACLLIMGSFTLVAVNMNATLSKMEQENEIIAYVDESLTLDQAKTLEANLKAVPNVLSCTFVSRDDAMKDFAAEKQENSLFQNLPSKILRHRYHIRMKNIEQMNATVSQIKQIKGISSVSALLDISKGFITVRNIAGGVAVILIVVLLVISVFIISNTTRMATFSRREEIAIMKMVGATNWFIRWPFIYEGLILGVFAAIVAFFLQWGIYDAIVAAISRSDTMSLFVVLPFQHMALSVVEIFIATGFLVGVGGSMMTIRKFLRV